MNDLDGFEFQALDDSFGIYLGKLPERSPFLPEHFETIWQLHPSDYHSIMMHGRTVKTPRWQQAYGVDYQFTGATNHALPITEDFVPFQKWCFESIASNLNGLLVNWYDGKKAHYIGPHRDAPKGLIENSYIVTISLGEERIFRMRPWKGKGSKDFVLDHGKVVVIPWKTNLNWTHEVPKFVKYKGRRISITLRAFDI
ncbi:MAG: alpha-ketoglutarate-dependent dioxygenase AlkB [Flavobacteriales bacterium]|nr:alpha-ketoglutarate-dependent dioxygenase AlkB [Flavobacteriales bacterium]